ncbi:hypothetical protein K503DRAFT_806576 [Rhizopogon vinicolor AM-OR11-026]|uniref:Uncharacterized protein n=1 Tax=Rhizopogon vinicolor AM-OR11-026 TaxID=1314800 RepID=A0A1B7ME75_9AGAM|nr:hypothetical protein K503DRAFT_806576 [Rhizopogon vinicolor AM-OR11-026]
MTIAPYPVQCYQESKWSTIQSDKLLPRDALTPIPMVRHTLAFTLFMLIMFEYTVVCALKLWQSSV